MGMQLIGTCVAPPLAVSVAPGQTQLLYLNGTNQCSLLTLPSYYYGQ